MDNSDMSETVFTDEQPLPPAPESQGIGMVWKIVIAVVALGIIAISAYSFLQNQPGAQPQSQSQSSENSITGSSAEELFQQGNAFVEAGQLQQAATAYQQAVEMDPEYQAAYANLGVVYYQLEQLDLAAQQYEKALEINPDDGDVAYNLGALRLQQALSGGGQPDEDLLNQAIDQLETALELSPDLAEPHFTLGVAYATLNRREEAIAAFEQFLEKDTGQDPRASQEAERYLESLKAQ